MATYSECKNAADKLREQAEGMLALADWLETDGPKMHKYAAPYVSDRNFQVYLTESDSYRDEAGNWQTEIKETETKANIAKFLDAVGSCEKEYQDDNLKIIKRFGPHISIVGQVKREISCTKKVVTREWVEPHTIAGHYREEVEWDCDTLSLLALVKE